MAEITPLDLATILSIIGAATGAISISALIYALGYKFGKIENALSYVNPNTFGEMSAKIEILWKLYVEDRKQTISQDLLQEITRLLSKGNPASEIAETVKAVLVGFGLRISEVTISRIIFRPEEKREELTEVTELSQLRELPPNTILVVEVKIRTDEEEAVFLSRYRITLDKAEPLGTEIEEFEAGRPIDAELMARTAEKLRGYVGVISEVITLVIQGLFQIKLRKAGNG